jgi:hypothetical protein
MPITIKCPKCGRSHRAREALAGKRVKCSCGEALQVPAAASPSAAPAGLLDELLPGVPPPAATGLASGGPLRSAGSSARGKAKSAGPSGGVILAIAGGATAAIALVIGVIVWAVTSGRTATIVKAPAASNAPASNATGAATAGPAAGQPADVSKASPAETPTAPSATPPATALESYRDEIDGLFTSADGRDS